MKLPIPLFATLLFFSGAAFAEDLKCDLRGFKAASGLTAETRNGTWNGKARAASDCGPSLAFAMVNQQSWN